MKVAILGAGQVGLAIALANTDGCEAVQSEPLTEWQVKKIYDQIGFDAKLYPKRNKSDRKRDRANRWR
jgi:transposase